MRLSCASAMVESSVSSGWPALTRSPSRALICLDDPAFQMLDHDVLAGRGDVAGRDRGAGQRRGRRPQAEAAERNHHEQIAEHGDRRGAGVDRLRPVEDGRFLAMRQCLVVAADQFALARITAAKDADGAAAAAARCGGSGCGAGAGACCGPALAVAWRRRIALRELLQHVLCRAVHFDLALAQHQDAVALGGDRRTVGDQHHGRAARLACSTARSSACSPSASRLAFGSSRMITFGSP